MQIKILLSSQVEYLTYTTILNVIYLTYLTYTGDKQSKI